MPIYEYRCAACGHGFELLVRSSTVPACPKCASDKLDKQLSVFSQGSPGLTHSAVPAGFTPPGPCGSCGSPDGPGSCSIH